MRGGLAHSHECVAAARGLTDRQSAAGVDDMKEMGYFSWQTDPAEVAERVQAAAAAAGFPRPGGPSTGVLMKVVDGNVAPPFPGCLDFNKPGQGSTL